MYETLEHLSTGKVHSKDAGFYNTSAHMHSRIFPTPHATQGTFIYLASHITKTQGINFI